ncbi:MAG: DNA polymerase III subunit delta, partial [Chthoniobacteraceae bacterium]
MPATKAAIRIQAVLGSDEAAVKEAARAHAAKLNSGGEFGADIIDGVADNAAQAADKIHRTIEALLTFPFFGGEKLVWLKNANFLGDSQMGRAAAVIDALEQLVEILKSGLPE